MKTIGIVSAMHKELEPILNFLKTESEQIHAKYNFTTANYKELKIVTAECGIGKANAALATQLLIDKFNVDCVINAGVAGSLSDSLNVFDMVIPSSCTYHDISQRFMENYPPYQKEFFCDEKLKQYAKDVCDKSSFVNYEGLLVSGDKYIDTEEARNAIIENYSPLAVDMESAAISLCAYRNDVPFLILRCISDNADSETTIDPDEFEKIASNKAADVIHGILDKLSG